MNKNLCLITATGGHGLIPGEVASAATSGAELISLRRVGRAEMIRPEYGKFR